MQHICCIHVLCQYTAPLHKFISKVDQMPAFKLTCYTYCRWLIEVMHVFSLPYLTARHGVLDEEGLRLAVCWRFPTDRGAIHPSRGVVKGNHGQLGTSSTHPTWSILVQLHRNILLISFSGYQYMIIHGGSSYLKLKTISQTINELATLI